MKKEIDNQVFNLMDALRSPVLTHSITWSDCIPGRLLDVITIARMKSLILKEEMASLPEVCAFMMSRTFESPMSSEWCNIYFYVSCTVCEEYWKEDHWDEITERRTLTDYEDRYLLKPLRKFIYDRRRKALKERMKTEKIPEKESEEPRVVECQQLSLFE